MQKVTPEELKEVQDLRETLIMIISTIGELHLAKKMLLKDVEQIEEKIKNEEQKFENFQEQERVIYDKLQTKYGAGNIDLDTGELTV